MNLNIPSGQRTKQTNTSKDDKINKARSLFSPNNICKSSTMDEKKLLGLLIGSNNLSEVEPPILRVSSDEIFTVTFPNNTVNAQSQITPPYRTTFNGNTNSTITSPQISQKLSLSDSSSLSNVNTSKPVPPPRSSSLQSKNKPTTISINSSKQEIFAETKKLENSEITTSSTISLTQNNPNQNHDSNSTINRPTRPISASPTQRPLCANYTKQGINLIMYFNDKDPLIKNKKLAQIKTNEIQKIDDHDKYFNQFFGFTFEEFLLVINGYSQNIMPPFHQQKFALTRSSALSFQPNMEYDPTEPVHNNSAVLVNQTYTTSNINASFTVKGHKTHPSNNRLSTPIENAVGINHNTVIMDFFCSIIENSPYSIKIETNGSYPKQSNSNANSDINALLEQAIKGKQYPATVINVRFLNNVVDRKLYTNNYDKIGEAIGKNTHINYYGLFISSYGKGTGTLIPKIEGTKSQAHKLTFYLKNIIRQAQDTNNLAKIIRNHKLIASHIIYLSEYLISLLQAEQFKHMGTARKIFGLLVIITSTIAEEKQPIIIAGCKSAKDRTGAFIFCALIISTIFFHRALDTQNTVSSEQLFSFLNSEGELINLNDEELDLVKAQLNNPILYNILSKLGIGEYNNKNLYIIEDFICNYPELKAMIILKELINSKV